MRQIDPLQCHHGFPDTVLCRKGCQTKTNIVENGHMRKQRKILKHQADATFFRRHENVRAGNDTVIQKYTSAALRLYARSNAQERCLAGT